uniref:hypothetical protein n=1 Tax=Halomonas sp. TaxID=1486246 RepID=UPI00260E9A44|nr:hypothetical protein [Halomonas sp.]
MVLFRFIGEAGGHLGIGKQCASFDELRKPLMIFLPLVDSGFCHFNEVGKLGVRSTHQVPLTGLFIELSVVLGGAGQGMDHFQGMKNGVTANTDQPDGTFIARSSLDTVDRLYSGNGFMAGLFGSTKLVQYTIQDRNREI